MMVKKSLMHKTFAAVHYIYAI